MTFNMRQACVRSMKPTTDLICFEGYEIIYREILRREGMLAGLLHHTEHADLSTSRCCKMVHNNCTADPRRHSCTCSRRARGCHIDAAVHKHTVPLQK